MKKSDINILIVEDDSTFRSVLTEGFKRSGYKPIAVSTPEEALNVVKIKVIHLAIVDCMLPKMNGVDLVVELKKNGLESAPLILMSGIFKDKSFITKSINKTKAVEFYCKPFDLKDLLDKVDDLLKDVVDTPKLPLHVLLSKAKLSTRDKIKALDRVDQITGFDLPFIFNLVFMSEADGALNIFGKNFSIYGVSFSQGNIYKVDSDRSEELIKKILLEDDCIKKTTLEEFENKKLKGDMLTNLVDENYLSPHVLGTAKQKQIALEIRDMIQDTEIEINFSPTPGSDDEFYLSAADYFRFQNEMISSRLTLNWFENFYSSLVNHPIEFSGDIPETHPLNHFGLIKENENIKSLLSGEEVSLKNLLDKSEDKLLVYKVIHLMSINRFLHFNESKKKEKSISINLSKIQQLSESFANKNAEEIFQYFGASKLCKPDEVSHLYKDFAKSYHPDKFSSTLSEDVKKSIHDLFAKVTEAHNILIDAKSRESYEKQKLQKSAEKQFKSDSLLERGVQALHQLKFSEAMQLIKEAHDVHKTEKSQLYYYWVAFKMPDFKIKEILSEVKSYFEQNSDIDNSTSVEYFMVKGLYLKHQKDLKNAVNYFNQVLKLDPKALYARRELSTLSKGSQKNNKSGDIVSLFSNMFKKKSG